jgi:cytochrome c-type biogenesis protein CcmE
MGLIIAILLGVGSTVGLMLYALNQNMDLFYTPTELVMGKDGVKPEVGQRLRIGGMVVEGSVRRDMESLRVSFDLADVGPKVTIEYDGILPDLFREGQGIVAQGVLKDSTTIEAFEVLAKHDEDYMPPEIAEAMEVIHEPLQYTDDQIQGSGQ